MIVIYNLIGLLVGAVGVLLGLGVLALTKKLGFAVLTLAIVWIVLGFLWRRWKVAPGQPPRAYPSVFFIPLPFLAIPIIPLAFLILVLELMGGQGAVGTAGAGTVGDRRAALLREDEQSLDRARISGDVELSGQLANRLTSTLSDEAKADMYHIFTRVSPSKVLVLVKAPNLKSYKESARVQLLHAIREILSEHDDLKSKSVYIGVKGRFAFGTIQVPPGRVEVGSVLSNTPLLDFYRATGSGPDNSQSGAAVPIGESTDAPP